MNVQEQDFPWLDSRLTKEITNHLQNAMDIPALNPVNKKTPLAGNISKSTYIQDKDNLFYETVLKEMSEYMYLKNSWSNYFKINIAKTKQFPEFKLKRLWVNYQKQHEFNPSHRHGGLYSFVVFMKIPTHWKEQHALPFSVNSNTPCASNFEFLLGNETGEVQPIPFPLSPEDEGRMLFFPAWVQHQVFPFYGTEEERITISGNIVYNLEKNDVVNEIT